MTKGGTPRPGALLKALAILQKVHRGDDHPGVATSHNNLAVLYDAQGRYAEAEVHHRKALAIREKVLPADHPGVATSHNNLAVLYHEQGRYAEAGEHFLKALAIRERVSPPDHPDVATSCNNLAIFYKTQGQCDKARSLYERARDIFAKSQTILGLLRWVEVLKNLGDYVGALGAVNSVIDMIRGMEFGDSHPFMHRARLLRKEILDLIDGKQPRPKPMP